jgi:addiction module RelE/StbE family toxin
MLTVKWTDEALADLEKIAAYISDRNALAALRVQELVQRTAEQLPAHPYLYRPGRVDGTREAVVHPNYVLVYAVREVIEIIAVLHARRQYP